MPSFCRHNRLLQNCPICTREQQVELRPVVSPGGQRAPSAGPSSSSTSSRAGTATTRTGARATNRLTVRKLARGAEDGYRSPLVPGLRSGDDARRLAEELAFAATRLATLASDPPGLYAEVADAARPLEERTWLALLIAYLGPLDGEDPFAAISEARTTWESGELPELGGVITGPRTAYVPSRGQRTLEAYRAWAGRAGSQAAAFNGEAAWTPERRFDRVYERLALPGFERAARFDLLTTLGRLGVYELGAQSLHFGGSDEVTLAAKRVLGIGDSLLLERRAADLAAACELPIAALDLGLYNWERGSRTTAGMGAADEPDEALLAAARGGLGV
ncbi:MAG: hypothetical protein WAK93_05470 [Solirubrobacteraceae bacterium]